MLGCRIKVLWITNQSTGGQLLLKQISLSVSPAPVPQDWLTALIRKLARRQLDLSEFGGARRIIPDADIRQVMDCDGDWEAIQAICGYSQAEFTDGGVVDPVLPLTAAAIQHFCRNHRDCDASLTGQFECLDESVSAALAAFYELYHAQTLLDAEAALFIAQSSGSVRVARSMADMLTIGSFNLADRAFHCEGRIYAVATAFDTAQVIDAINAEAVARLALPNDDTEHLLQLTPDAIGLLAARIAASSRLQPRVFFRKANLLAEARQDVNRFPARERFAVALYEGDLPVSEPWVSRLVAGMRHMVPHLVGNLPARATDQAQISA